MKKIIQPLYLITPSILISLINYVHHVNFPIDDVVYLAALYAITIIGIALFFIFKLHRFGAWVLPVGLIISPIYTIIFEYRNRLNLPPYLRDFGIPYVGTMFSIIYYALPFTVVSIIVYALLILIFN